MRRQTVIHLVVAIVLAVAIFLLTGLVIDGFAVRVVATAIGIALYWRMWRGEWGLPRRRSWIDSATDTPDRMRGDSGWV